MKKILIACLSIFLIVGCSNTMMDTPSKKVEDFLGKYQKLDEDVLTQLDVVVDSDTTMNENEKKEYKDLMKKQYQNFSYKITNEDIQDDLATVDVEIEVYDYKSAIEKAKKYYDNHKEEFKDDGKEYIEYKISELKNVKDRANYIITFNLTKEKNEWKVSDLTDIDRQKIHGLY